MAKNDSSLATAAKPVAAGAISSATTKTTLPTDATTDLVTDLVTDLATGFVTGFVKLGYVSEDGLTNGLDTDVENIKAWGGDTILTVRTSRTETFKFTLVQALDIDVLKEIYGQDNVTGDLTTGITVKHNGNELPRRAFVFDMLMTGNVLKRIVVPAGQVTEVGDVTYVDGSVVGYETTVTCFPDAQGNTVYEYIKKKA